MKGGLPVKDIIRWLETKLFRSKPVNPPIESESPKPDKTELDLPKDMQDLVNDAPPPSDVENEDDDGNTLPCLSLGHPSSSDADKTT